MNSVADASSSLFQICVALRQRLLGVPGFSESLAEEEEEADDDTDPVTLLWRTFRRGYPLMLLYNALRPQQPLSMPQGVKEEKKAKAATFKFIQACITDLKIPNEELFIITDLYGDDTTGFVKVARIVNRVLDVLVQRGLVEDVRPTASDFEEAEKGIKRTQRQHIVSELVRSERTYVQHLELLQSFKHLVEEKGVIPGDAVHDIFLNLNSLLDFQRRFLIRVEQTNWLPEEEQNWGKLFLLYCEAFKVYEPYIANQRKCEKTVIAEFGKLREAGGSLEMRQMVESPTALHSFLMKPFQRLTKYPLLLEQLHKKGDLDDERKQDLLNGMEASTAVLSRTNKAVDQEEKREAVHELQMRVEDWKGHRVEGFGDLLLYGTFTVLKSENLANGKDGERQVSSRCTIVVNSPPCIGVSRARNLTILISTTCTCSRRSSSVARTSTLASPRTNFPASPWLISWESQSFSSRGGSLCKMSRTSCPWRNQVSYRHCTWMCALTTGHAGEIANGHEI